MQRRINISSKLLPPRLASTLNLLLKDEAISGKLLIAASVLALLVVNSPLRSLYDTFWHTDLSIGIGNAVLSEDLLHWVNDGLMAIFFLVIGLEIKREIVHGQLRKPRKAVLPIAAAIGGMAVPALIYALFNMSGEALGGWGIPVATDIAFAIGVLALLGSRVPSALKIFLLTLAIVDDLLAILIIALFYTADINNAALMAAAGIVVLLLISRKVWPRSIVPYVLLGIALWIAVKSSGVHATIAGAMIGFLAPIHTRPSIAERLERSMIPVSTFIVIPLFAFANAGVVFSGLTFDGAVQPIIFGIIAGLIAGKVLGILGTTWLLTKFGDISLPEDSRWVHMFGISLLAGIGFTVSIFITELAFVGNDTFIAAAKVSIIIASVLAAVAGTLTLLYAHKRSSR